LDVHGDLQVISLPTLVQFIAQEGGQSLIQIEDNTNIGRLYFDQGHLRHAELLITSDGNEEKQIGEEVVYELLNWPTGIFTIKKNIPAPEHTVQQSWDFLLMEGLRQLDEQQIGDASPVPAQEQETLHDILSDISEADAAIIHEIAAQQQKEHVDMANIKDSLDQIMAIDGAIAAALVDWESGLTLGTIGSGLNIELAAAGNTNVIKAKMGVMKDLKLKGTIEDILITLSEQYHLVRMLESQPNLFIYVALNRSQANLGLARHRLINIEHELNV
jgi:hypothetical protein